MQFWLANVKNQNMIMIYSIEVNELGFVSNLLGKAVIFNNVIMFKVLIFCNQSQIVWNNVIVLTHNSAKVTGYVLVFIFATTIPIKEMQTSEGSYLRELIKSMFSQAHLVYLFTLLLTLFVKLYHSISQKAQSSKAYFY